MAEEPKTVWTPEEATDALLVNAACELQHHGHTHAEAHERARYWLDVITAQVKAEAWDEGYRRGSIDDFDGTAPLPSEPTPNPYRAAEAEATR